MRVPPPLPPTSYSFNRILQPRCRHLDRDARGLESRAHTSSIPRASVLPLSPFPPVFNGMPAYEKWEWKSNIGNRWEAVPIMICLQIQASRDRRRETSTTAHVLGVGERRLDGGLDGDTHTGLGDCLRLTTLTATTDPPSRFPH